MNNIVKILTTPMGDDDINEYLKGVNILKYSQLKDYNNIEELLPTHKSYFIILYEFEPNYGHFCCCMRDKNNNIIYFDSYGMPPSQPLKENTEEVNIQLGQDKPYLNMLFDKTPLPVLYNGYQFQNDNSDIATCGRWCILIIKCIKENATLQEFIKTFKDIKKKQVSPDLVVSKIITKT